MSNLNIDLPNEPQEIVSPTRLNLGMVPDYVDSENNSRVASPELDSGSTNQTPEKQVPMLGRIPFARKI